ncbi:MAG: DUF1552 domain-containing protein [Myxococcota bacterium]
MSPFAKNPFAMRPIARRRLLRLLGLGGAAALLPSLRPRETANASPDCPPRVLFFTTQHGAPRQHWKMDVPGLPADEDGAVSLDGLDRGQFSHVLEPLYDVRHRLSVLEGMAMVSAMLDEPGNNHGVSWAHLLTNTPANYQNPLRPGPGGIHPYPTAVSIDQHIAAEIAPPGSIPSVQWGTGGRYGDPFGYSTAADGAWLPLEREPADAFMRLMQAGLPTGEMPAEPSRAQRIAAERASVLDLAASEYDALIPRLSGEDARKLELHRDQIRDLELRLGGGGRNVTCDPSFDANGERIDQFLRLAALALSCDVTRVIALDVGELRPDDFGAPSGSNVHQDWAHGTSDTAYMHMANYYRYHAEQFAALVGYLDGVPEGDGTLLDNTMVIWLTELATGGHDLADGLAVVAGGSASGLHPGRYVRFAQNRAAPCSSYGCQRGADIGPGHSHLFVSAMQHMGMSDTSFNQAEGTALDGSRIDLSGPLPLL